MSNQWLRLWHDMPNDPKWRTIARISGQPISLVQAVYLHLLVDASRNVTRGHVTVTAEDLASALDVTDEAIAAVLAAMQGRVLDGQELSGWEKRQPKREDQGNDESGAKSAAERQRDKRARDKASRDAEKSRESHGASRDVTTDKDTDKELSQEPNGSFERGSPREQSDEPPQTSVPANLTPTLQHRGIAANLHLDLGNELAMFLANAKSKGHMSADWNASFELWLRRSRNFGSGKDQQPKPATTKDQRTAAMDTLGVGQQYLTGGNHAALAS